MEKTRKTDRSGLLFFLFSLSLTLSLYEQSPLLRQNQFLSAAKNVLVYPYTRYAPNDRGMRLKRQTPIADRTKRKMKKPGGFTRTTVYGKNVRTTSVRLRPLFPTTREPGTKIRKSYCWHLVKGTRERAENVVGHGV